MVTRFPQHSALEMLLEQKQFDACRMVAEKMIEELMAPPRVEGEQSAASAANRWQERDLELAHLLYLLAQCLRGMDEYETAAIKADMAGLLARKAKDMKLYVEAVHLAGGCHGQVGSYRTAIQHYTDCLAHAEGIQRARAFYNRGHMHERQGAFAFAVPDLEQAIELAKDQDEFLLRTAMITLAWNLILLKEFHRAERTIEQLLARSGAGDDGRIQAQVAHDRLHMAFLQGQGKDAFTQALRALRPIAQDYPHVRAHIALTLMSLATEQNLAEEASVVGLLAKRLAGMAKRQDLDDEVNRRLQGLEAQAGTDSLVQALTKTRQLMPGAVGLRRTSRRGQKIGGVG